MLGPTLSTKTERRTHGARPGRRGDFADGRCSCSGGPCQRVQRRGLWSRNDMMSDGEESKVMVRHLSLTIRTTLTATTHAVACRCVVCVVAVSLTLIKERVAGSFCLFFFLACRTHKADRFHESMMKRTTNNGVVLIGHAIRLCGGRRTRITIK